jgi:hypothetical protein
MEEPCGAALSNSNARAVEASVRPKQLPRRQDLADEGPLPSDESALHQKPYTVDRYRNAQRRFTRAPAATFSPSALVLLGRLQRVPGGEQDALFGRDVFARFGLAVVEDLRAGLAHAF